MYGKKYKRKPGKSGTEYLWRVNLSGGDGILLHGFESSGFWATSVLLNLGPEPADELHLITSKVAYWAGGIAIPDRGGPVPIPVRSADEMFAAVTKAALPAGNAQTNTRRHSNICRGGPPSLTALLKGAPSILKMYLVKRRDEFGKYVMYNEEPQAPRRVIPYVGRSLT